MELRHPVGASTQTIARVNLKGIVRTLSEQQLIGNVSQFNYLIIISPTDLRRGKWPGPRGEFNTFKPSGHFPSTDKSLPTTADTINFRGTSKAITLVSPVYDGDECVRIELKVIG